MSDVFDLDKLAGKDKGGKKKSDIVDRGRLNINDLIAPDAMEIERNHLHVGDRYVRTIFVAVYPRSGRIGWLNRLYAVGANIDISSHIEPLSTDKVIKILQKKIGQYISTQRMDMQKGRDTDISVQTAREDAEALRDALHKNQEKFFYQTLYINIEAKTLEQLDSVTEQIETLCGNIGLTTRHAMFQQKQGFNSVLPIAEDQLKEARNFDTSSLATCFPIVSAELTNTSGTPILYGTNMINGSLVMFDRFKLPNYNSVTIATTGAGKSYFVKLESIRLMSLGTNIIIIDPESEYTRIAKELGGQVIKLSSSSKDRINPLEIEATEEEDGQNFLTQKMLDVLSIIEVMVKRELDAREKKVLLDAIRKTYERFGITSDKKSVIDKVYQHKNMFQLEGSKKKMPILSDLEQTLRQTGEEGIAIADELEPYTSGVLSLFNGETNVDLDAQFITFDIKDLEQGLSELSMFITLEFIWNKIKKGDLKKRLVVVDEASTLLENEGSARYVIRVARRARKFNAGISVISQQPGDFLKNGGEAIIGNTGMQILLKQQENGLEPLAKMFGLSRSELDFLRTANPGEALIFANGNHTAVEVVSNDFEHILCTTNPEDLEKIRDLLGR